ncbi:LLM class flavin-dependent oxidoreductase [Rhodococcus qingshengii]|uniref:LLM class flavin-dependent oxidoreductase n=1 Tax=Rhodococcus qingshengii TaxID=334542 RepID=UPI0036570829
MRLSLMYPVMPGAIEPVYPYAELVLERGLERLWFGTSLFLSEQVVMAALAGRYQGLSLGSAVTLTPLRTAPEMALTSRSIAALSGAPFTLGIGAGGASLQRAMNGSEYARPASAVRDYIGATREMLLGRRVIRDTEALQLDTTIPRIPTPPVELAVGVLRPRMARVTGECADAAITWMATPEYIEKTLVPELEKGAAEKNRPMPRVITVLHCALAQPHRDPVALVIGALGGHLVAPHYLDMLRREGIDAHADKPEAGARALLDAGIFGYGTEGDIADVVRRYAAAGVDELVINACGVYSQEGATSALRSAMDTVGIAAAAASPTGVCT